MKFETYMVKIVGELKKVLGLVEYAGTINFPENDSGGTAMDINVDVKYLRFSVQVYPVCRGDYKLKRYDDLLEYMTHELCHIITEPLYDKAVRGIATCQQDDLEVDREQATQRICNIVMKLTNPSKYYPNEFKSITRPVKQVSRSRRTIGKNK